MKVTLPRLPGVGRARCYYANGLELVTASGLSPDRAGLRIRALEMLCICGGTAYDEKLAEHQRIALWTPWWRGCFRDSFLVYAGRAP